MDARPGQRIPNPASVARKFIGTPFVHQGRVPGAGLDCVGLLVAVAREMGIEPVDSLNYPRIPTPGWLIPHLKLNMFQDGSGPVAAFWIRRPTDEPYHVGILDHERGTMIHTFYNLGKVVEHRFDDRWKKRVHSLWQLSH